MVFWFEAIGGILAFGAVVFYYASLGIKLHSISLRGIILTCSYLL